jgi:lipid A 3-O-deacylase
LKSTVVAIAGVLAIISAADAQAGTSGAVYDMDRLLRQPHPFARPAPPSAPPAAQPVRPAPVVQPPPRPAPAAPPRRAVQTQAPAAASPSKQRPAGDGGGDIVSEVRLGFLIHDQGPASHNKEGGYDGNLEVLFTSPDFLDMVGAPRPHFGGSVNSQGDTSQVYLGLTWEWEFFDAAFFNFSFGGAYHTGEKTTDDRDKKELGCKVLFRESIDLGYRFADHHGVSVFLDHISNAKLCSENEGLENVGLRYGYKF